MARTQHSKLIDKVGTSSSPVSEVNTEQLSIGEWAERMYYVVAKVDTEYKVKNCLTGEIEKTITNENNAQDAFQYAYDNAPDVAAIGIRSAGINNPYLFSAPFVIDKDATTLAGMPRHGVLLKPVAGAGVSEVIKSNYGGHCSMLWGLKFDGNNESTDSIHLYNVGGSAFRVWHCHWGGDVGGWAIYNESATKLLIGGQGNIRGAAGDIYSDEVVEAVGSHIYGANIDGGTGGIQGITKNDIHFVTGVDFGGPLTGMGTIKDWTGTVATIAFGKSDDSQNLRIERESDGAAQLVLDPLGQKFNTFPKIADDLQFYGTPTFFVNGGNIDLEGGKLKDIDSFVVDRPFYSVLSSGPASPVQGQLAFADGVNWNPGSGSGVYVYDGGAWQYLGGAGTV